MTFSVLGEKTAIYCLAQHDWKLDIALDNYFANQEVRTDLMHLGERGNAADSIIVLAMPGTDSPPPMPSLNLKSLGENVS